MNVRELIKELKKMPQNMNVGVAMHDNSAGEVAAWASSVVMEYEVDIDTGEDTDNEVVIILC